MNSHLPENISELHESSIKQNYSPNTIRTLGFILSFPQMMSNL